MTNTPLLTPLWKPVCRESCLPNLSSPAPDIHLGEAQQREQDALAAHTQNPQDTWTTGPAGLLLEANKPDATLAVIDTFGTAPNQKVDHGEITSALAMQASGLGESNLLRVDDSFSPFKPVTAQNFGDGLDQFIESRYAGFTHNTTAALKEIHENYPQINTISQSQGLSGPKLTGDIARHAQNDPNYALQLGQELGHPGPLDWNKPAPQRLIAERVQDTLAASPEVAGELTALRQELADHPEVAYFNSAGNDGQTQDLLSQAGFRFDPAWNGSPQSTSPLTQSVAAAMPIGPDAYPTTYSQRTLNDIAFDGRARVTVDGQPLCESATARPAPLLPWCAPFQGTSFAAPLAAGTYNADPQAYERLRMQALPPVEGATVLGTGMLH